MELRTLRPSEREALLDLLDAWDVGDGWRGREFFRRYLEDDATYRDDHVWVASEGGRLLSCVQIFPRRLRTPAGPVPAGGIGSVFTAEEARRRGLAEALLARAADAMRGEGMWLSMLFASRLAWYAKLGWRSHGLRSTLVRRGEEGPGPPPAGLEVAAFDAASDLPAVRALHEAYSDGLTGTVARDDALWETSLRNAGNPREEFLLARSRGALVAYLRATVLYGILCVTEFARAPGFEAALAELFARATEPRADDPWARAARPSRELRSVASVTDLRFDPDLAVALAKRSLALHFHDDPSCMLRCLDADALARHLRVPRRDGEAEEAFLARALPPEEFSFWSADRF